MGALSSLFRCHLADVQGLTRHLLDPSRTTRGLGDSRTVVSTP